MIRLSNIGLPLIGGVLVSFAVFACSSSDEPPADATGGAPGTGGSKATGGGKATGGTTASGGGTSTGGVSTEALYVCENAAPRARDRCSMSVNTSTR